MAHICVRVHVFLGGKGLGEGRSWGGLGPPWVATGVPVTAGLGGDGGGGGGIVKRSRSSAERVARPVTEAWEVVCCARADRLADLPPPAEDEGEPQLLGLLPGLVRHRASPVHPEAPRDLRSTPCLGGGPHRMTPGWGLGGVGWCQVGDLPSPRRGQGQPGAPAPPHTHHHHGRVFTSFAVISGHTGHLHARLSKIITSKMGSYNRGL